MIFQICTFLGNHTVQLVDEVDDSRVGQGGHQPQVVRTVRCKQTTLEDREHTDTHNVIASEYSLSDYNYYVHAPENIFHTHTHLSITAIHMLTFNFPYHTIQLVLVHRAMLPLHVQGNIL